MLLDYGVPLLVDLPRVVRFNLSGRRGYTAMSFPRSCAASAALGASLFLGTCGGRVSPDVMASSVDDAGDSARRDRSGGAGGASGGETVIGGTGAAASGGRGGSGGSGDGSTTVTCDWPPQTMGPACQTVYDKIVACCADQTTGRQMAQQAVCAIRVDEIGCEEAGAGLSQSACSGLALHPQCTRDSGADSGGASDGSPSDRSLPSSRGSSSTCSPPNLGDYVHAVGQVAGDEDHTLTVPRQEYREGTPGLPSPRPRQPSF